MSVTLEEVTEEGLVPGPLPLVLGEWGKHLIIYSGVCACVKGFALGVGRVGAGGLWSSLSCGA